MAGEDNIKTVQSMYEAFGRGDVAAVLEGLADDVDWGTDTSSTAAPWYGVRHGKDQVADFFAAFGGAMDVQEFTPFAFASSDDEVHSVVRCRATARSTGKQIDQNLHHYFRFREGLVEFYRGTEDTAQTLAALQS